MPFFFLSFSLACLDVEGILTFSLLDAKKVNNFLKMLKKGVKQSSGREIYNIVGGEKKQEFQIRCGENFVSRDTRIALKMTELFQATKSRNDKENRQRDVDLINEHDYSDSVHYRNKLFQ